MKKKIFIFVIIIIVSVVIILSPSIIKLVINYKKNKDLKEKYNITNNNYNLLSGIHLSEGTYKVANSTELIIQDKKINKELFEKHSNEIQIPNKDLKYYGYIIGKDGTQCIYTPIVPNYNLLFHEVPLSKEDYKFIKDNLFKENEINCLEIFPFEDKKHLFIELHYNVRKYKNLFAFVNLSNKTIKYLDNPYFYTARMNLKENVVIVRSDTRPIYSHVFNENGDFITKYE